MDSHSRYEKLNNQLQQLLTDLQKCNELRYQLLVDLQFYFENIDRINNTSTYQEKSAQKQAERIIHFQKEEREITLWLYEKIKKQMERENELLDEQQRYYDKLKSIQENSLSAITEKEKELLEAELEGLKNAHQHYIQMLFETIQECQQQILFLNNKIAQIEEEIRKCREEAADLLEVIIYKNNKIIENEERIAFLDTKIVALDKKEGELHEERKQIIEKAFVVDANSVSKFDLLRIKNDDHRLMNILNKVDLIRQGIAIIEFHHASIIKELKNVLAKEEMVDHMTIEKAINSIVKNLLEQNYKEFLSEEEMDYFIGGLTADAYYKKEVGKLISEIIQSPDLPRDLNNNLTHINSVKVEKIEIVKEHDQRDKEKVQLKEEVSQAVDRYEKVTEKQAMFEKDYREAVSERNINETIKSGCEQEKNSVERHKELHIDIDKIKAKQDEIKEGQEKFKKERMEKLRRLRKSKEAKGSGIEAIKPKSSNGHTFFHAENKPARDNKEQAVEIKEKAQANEINQAENRQSASNDAPFTEARGKKLG